MTFIQINVIKHLAEYEAQRIQKNQEQSLKAFNNDDYEFAETLACKQQVLTPSQLKKYCETV